MYPVCMFYCLRAVIVGWTGNVNMPQKGEAAGMGHSVFPFVLVGNLFLVISHFLGNRFATILVTFSPIFSIVTTSEGGHACRSVL